MSSPGDCSQAEALLSKSKGGRPECITAHAYVSDAEQRGNAGAARRTLAMTRWSRTAEEAALVKDSRGEQRKEAGGWLRRNLKQSNKKFER